MRKRLMCVWLPHWPLQETLARRPEWKEHPVVLYATGGRSGQTVMLRSRKAAAQGVRPGMPLAQARALLDRESLLPRYEKFDPLLYRVGLKKLAEWCLRFSPLVGIEEAEVPECIISDITGCAHLFGGEQQMANHVVRALANGLEERSLVSHVAIADTLGAAWAVAHYCRQAAIVIPSGQHESALQPLPIEALRIVPLAVSKLRQLDIHTIGQLQALPRASLPSRFGVGIIRRLDQALGQRPELIALISPLPPVEVTQSFLYPTTNRQILETVLRKMIEKLAAAVKGMNRGIQRLICTFIGEQREEIERTVRLLEPTISARRLFELFRLQLDTTRLATDVRRIRLAAEVSALEIFRHALFDDVDQVDRRKEWKVLIERLSSRLGAQALVQPQGSLNPQPELAVAYPSVMASRSSPPVKKREIEESRALSVAPFRPPYILRQPMAIEVMSVIPDGPPIRFHWRGCPHTVARSWGPERIETSWWLGKHVRRDYYRVETTAGRRFWMFRQIIDGQWFLHGIFA